MTGTVKALTEAQRRALKAMPFSFATWGGKLQTRLPDGVTRPTLRILQKNGLAATERDRAVWKWSITDAGRAALAQEGQ